MLSRKTSHVAIGLLVVLACVARFVHLDADPMFPSWISYVVDEGRWSESARNLALFGTPDAFAERIHLLLSPAYQAGNLIAFKLFGVSFMSARASAAIAGSLIVVATFAALRPHVTPFALAFGVIVLGFETNMLAESRLALPEIPSALASLLAFLVLALMRKNRRNAALAGVIFAAAVALKGTTALIALAFVLIAGLPEGAKALGWRLARAASFVAGLALPLLGGLWVGLALGVVNAGGVTRVGAGLLSFVSLADIHSVAWNFVESPSHMARNLLLLGIWFCSWMWQYRRPDVSPVVRSLYLSSGIWTAWCFVVWTVNAYSPGRYLVHFTVPATIHIMVGLASADRHSLTRIASGLGRRGGLARAALFAWLVLPTAIVVGAVGAGLATLAGWDLSRVSAHMALVLASLVLLVILTYRLGASDRVIAGYMTAPIAATLLWLAGFELHVFRHFWESVSSGPILLWSGVAGAAIAAGFGWAFLGNAVQRPETIRPFVLVILAAPLLVQASIPMLAPTYSIRDASRDLGLALADAKEIRTANAASLFLENRLRYRELARQEGYYDAAVIFEHNRRSQNFMNSPEASALVRTHTYPLRVDSRYEYAADKDGSGADRGLPSQGIDSRKLEPGAALVNARPPTRSSRWRPERRCSGCRPARGRSIRSAASSRAPRIARP
jgi:hypothetical protein